MKERNDKVFKKILNKAFTQTMENFSFMVDLNNGEDKLSVSFEEYFEDTLANARLMSENSKEKSAACASAFALHSVNMIAQTREIHNRIDDFFASADNRDWFKENGISDDEKPAICSELKDYISDEMKIKGSTKEENDFIERVNAVFDSSKEELPTDQLKHTLDFISNVNKYLQNDYNAKDALNAAYNDSSFTDSEHKITDVIFEGISKLSGAIDKEAVDLYMKDISANYIEDNEVTAASFSKHYSADPTNLTPDEKAWAHKVYGRLLFNSFDLENGYDFENMDHTSFLVNGEQIISNEEYEKSKDENGIIPPEKCQEMEEKLAAKVASGADISVRMYAPEKTVDIDPADIKLKGIDAMSFRMFDSHYKDNPGRLTDYDKEWAMKAFDKMYLNAVSGKGSWNTLDMSSFYANGKQIISSEEFEKAKNRNGELSFEAENEMKIRIAARLAAGEKITVHRDVPEKPISFDLAKIKVNNKAAKNENTHEKVIAEPVTHTAEKSESARTSSVKENSEGKSIFEQTSEPNRTIKFVSEKEKTQNKPLSFVGFLNKIFQKLNDALSGISLTNRITDHVKKNDAKSKATRTKTNFIELVEIGSNANTKYNPKEKTNDKSLAKKGRTM